MTTSIATVDAKPDSEESVGTAWAASRWPGLVASALLIASAALQFGAAAQRWQFVDPGMIPEDRTIEDHRYDYVFVADPWVSIGSAAILYGVASLLIAAAILCLSAGATVSYRRRTGLWACAAVAAGPSILNGLHALISGMTGVPTALQYVVATFGAVLVGGVQALALVILAALVARRSVGWMLGLLILTGATAFGYIVAVLYVAPAIVGYQSYDTTPWTEAILAAVTALAAIAVLLGSLRSRTT